MSHVQSADRNDVAGLVMNSNAGHLRRGFPTTSPQVAAIRFLCVLLIFTTLAGCVDSSAPPRPPKKVTGLTPTPKTTDDIGEFDPDEGKVTVDSEVKISNPITGALEAYGPMKQKAAELGVTKAVQMFHALEGRYPKDHEEFMTRVIKENNIRLPLLGSGKKYEYDVENHQLLVVRDPAKKE